MRGFSFVGLLVAIVLTLVAAAVGYNVGLNISLATNAVPPAGYLPYGYGWGFGFPFFGLIFGLIFLFLLFGLIRRAAWGGRGGWWHHGEVPPRVDQKFQQWHRRAHGEPVIEQSETGERT